MHAIPTPASPWYTERWPWLLMLGPAIVLVGGACLGYLAVRHEDAMVVDDYYKQGKAINQDLRRDRVATAMRLSFSARYDPALGVIEGAIGSAGTGLAKPFRIHLAHATIPSKDILLEVRPDAAGSYRVALPLFEGGRWRVVVEGQARDWRLAGAWDWPKRQSIEIAADPAAAVP